jgi:hypothetical protein
VRQTNAKSRDQSLSSIDSAILRILGAALSKNEGHQIPRAVWYISLPILHITPSSSSDIFGSSGKPVGGAGSVMIPRVSETRAPPWPECCGDKQSSPKEPQSGLCLLELGATKALQCRSFWDVRKSYRFTCIRWPFKSDEQNSLENEDQFDAPR